jgi:hypothetical protein
MNLESIFEINFSLPTKGSRTMSPLCSFKRKIWKIFQVNMKKKQSRKDENDLVSAVVEETFVKDSVEIKRLAVSS